MSIETLKEKATTYTISQEYLDSKEKGRLEFVTKFPIDKISELTLDEFVLGTDKESFCYWLEFKKIEDKIIVFGVGGGNASKFGLYKSKDGLYQTGYGKNIKALQGNELNDCFNSIKNSITLALKYVKEDRVKDIKQTEIPFGKMILQKILSVYYPDKFITIGSSNVLIDLAKDINLQNIELTANNLIEINYECKKVIDTVPIFQNWSYEKIGSFVWEYFDGENKKGNTKNDSQKYYLVGAYWDGGNPADQSIRFIENGFWENGYDDKFIDDVNAVPIGSKIAIKATFTREKIKSVMAVKARGTVVENKNDGKTLVVEWDENFIPFEVDFSGGYRNTIKEVTNKEHIKAIFYNNSTNANAFELIRRKFQSSVFYNYINLLHKIISELKIQRNDQRIVYSVRDNSLNFTVGQRYCFNLYVSDSKGRYGVISKTKLHENSETYDGTPPQPYYSYFKDFNPNSFEWESIIDSITDELDRTSKSSYAKYNNADFENYVFSFKLDKIITQMNFPLNTIFYGPPGTGKTYNTILRAAEIVENRKIESYQDALKIFKENLHNSIEFITFHQNYSYEDFIQGLRPETDNKSSLTFDKRDGIFKKIADKALENLKLSEKAPDELSNEALFLNALEKLKDNIIDSATPIKINETAYFTAAEDDAFRYSGDNWTLHDKGFNGFRMKYSDLIRFYEENVAGRKEIKELNNISGLAKQHASYFFKAFELVKSMIDIKQKIKSIIEKKNYVIIIDEINRANISRVFGELITLIEPDKRSHGKIPLEAKMPSGDYFIVPSNLYIIGTMNTADKSIALLDIALRRRFEFESMYPLYEIEGSEIFDKDILLKINEQIIKSKGHDFQIGHAYFMGENIDLIERMNKKVIPLLLEYYMNDEKEVKAILFNAGLQVEENSWPIKITGKRA